MRSEPLDRAGAHLQELAAEIDTTGGEVRLTRDRAPDLVMMRVDTFTALKDELQSLEETMFWYQDALDRAADGEPPGDGESGPGLTEAEVRAKYGHLLQRRSGARD